MSPLFDVPVHLLVALTVASQSVKGPDEREAFAALFERAAARVTIVSRVHDVPSGPYLLSADAWLANARAIAPPALAVRIFKTSTGRHYMPPGTERDRLLSMRADPELADAVTRSAATQNKSILLRALGRPASTGELLMAHVMGTAAAIRVTQGAAVRPEQAFASVAGLEADVARFVGARAAALSVGEVYRQIAGKADSELKRVVTARSLKRTVETKATESEWVSPLGRQQASRAGIPAQ